jgi:hypothetical protein
MQAPFNAMIRTGWRGIDRPPLPNLLSIAICGGILRFSRGYEKNARRGEGLSEKIILNQLDEMIRAFVNGS